jgi:hypothetical protein
MQTALIRLIITIFRTPVSLKMTLEICKSDNYKVNRRTMAEAQQAGRCIERQKALAFELAQNLLNH